MNIPPPNCYPQCSQSKITDKLLRLNPCMDITILEIELPGTKIWNYIKKFFENIKNASFKGSMTALLTKKNQTLNLGRISQAAESAGTIDENINTSFFASRLGFFSLIKDNALATIPNIPIFSSPNIHTKSSLGFESNQSFFDFLKKSLSSGILSVLNSPEIGGLVSGVVNTTETLGSFLGWSPQLSPYFSFKKNPFSNKPSFEATIQLINDTEENAVKNARFLNLLLRSSLIGSVEAKNATGILDTAILSALLKEQNSLFHRWQPPNLFNVSLKFGADLNKSHYVKTFHLCSLDATVSAEGVFRKIEDTTIRIPDVYKVTLNFTSIMPDTIDAWLGDNFPGTDYNLIDHINENKTKENGNISNNRMTKIITATGAQNAQMSRIATQAAWERANNAPGNAQKQLEILKSQGWELNDEDKVWRQTIDMD